MGESANLTVGITPAERIRRIQEARHLAECERDEAKARVERLQEEVEAMRAKNGVLWQKWHSLREKSDLDVAESELRLQTAQRLMAERDAAGDLLREVMCYLDTHRAVLRQDFAADAERLELAARIKEQLNGETR